MSSVDSCGETIEITDRGRPVARLVPAGNETSTPAAVGRLFRLETDRTIRATAAAFAEPTLRSLDAIHLATAQVLANEAGSTLTAFVTYDQRLLASARDAGFPTASPGHV
jgi:antitoxin (DNA-binding transcriptional repressor) of toxin-antitoxin stability system